MTSIKKFQKHSKSQGFTLIELAIAFTVLAIIATLAIPPFNHLQARSESENIYPRLNNIIQHYKNDAIITRQNIILCSTSDGKTCNNSANWNNNILATYDQNTNNKVDHTDTIIQVHQNDIDYGTLIWTGAFKSNIIVLQRDTGLPRGSMGNFTYCSTKYPKELSHKSSLSQMGHLRYEKLNTC